VSSNFDPLDITEYTKAEIKAAVAEVESKREAEAVQAL
jgi:hypothetical protein